MTKFGKIVASHPIQKKPYHCIRFLEFGPHGTPLYSVTGDSRRLGAMGALKSAFERHGGHCFHCDKWHPPQPLGATCSRDHLRPRSGGGSDFLHNLVIACKKCNAEKGDRDVVGFRIERGSADLRALDEHLIRCIAQIDA